MPIGKWPAFATAILRFHLRWVAGLLCGGLIAYTIAPAVSQLLPAALYRLPGRAIVVTLALTLAFGSWIGSKLATIRSPLYVELTTVMTAMVIGMAIFLWWGMTPSTLLLRWPLVIPMFLWIGFLFACSEGYRQTYQPTSRPKSE